MEPGEGLLRGLRALELVAALWLRTGADELVEEEALASSVEADDGHGLDRACEVGFEELAGAGVQREL